MKTKAKKKSVGSEKVRPICNKMNLAPFVAKVVTNTLTQMLKYLEEDGSVHSAIFVGSTKSRQVGMEPFFCTPELTFNENEAAKYAAIDRARGIASSIQADFVLTAFVGLVGESTEEQRSEVLVAIIEVPQGYWTAMIPLVIYDHQKVDETNFTPVFEPDAEKFQSKFSRILPCHRPAIEVMKTDVLKPVSGKTPVMSLIRINDPALLEKLQKDGIVVDRAVH